MLLVPAKIMCFVQCENNPLQAVVHSCHSQSRKVSVLTNHWRLEFQNDEIHKTDVQDLENNSVNDSDIGEEIEPPQYHLSDDASEKLPLLRFVSVDVIERHCLMLPYHEKSHYLMQVIDFQKWPSRFLDDIDMLYAFI